MKEHEIENYIDRGLESIAPLLYTLSIIVGILLIVIGFMMMMSGKTAHNHKLRIISMSTIGIGLLALISGFMQYVL